MKYFTEKMQEYLDERLKGIETNVDCKNVSINMQNDNTYNIVVELKGDFETQYTQETDLKYEDELGELLEIMQQVADGLAQSIREKKGDE